MSNGNFIIQDYLLKGKFLRMTAAMDFTPEQIHAFRYWIQGYANFYEPIVMEWFNVAGYRVLRRPAKVEKADIQKAIDALFDGRRKLGRELNVNEVIGLLQKRSRMQPDLLLEKGDQRYLAELKSWGGADQTGQFDLAVATNNFIKTPTKGLFLLVDGLEGHRIAGKILVVAARSPQHQQVHTLLTNAYQAPLELLYLDELFRAPQLAGFIDRQLRYLDAAVAELKQNLEGKTHA